jgi:general secretion pathway protein G
VTKRAGGFTLIELVITLAMVGILASAIVPFTQLNVKRVKEAELRTALRDIRNALDAYKKAVDDGRIEKKVGESGYPPSLELLVQGVADARDPKKQAMRFLRRIPRDPMYPDSAAEAQETWGKRSYESAPDAPQEGADVYDVYSLSLDKGLNGIPYRDW